MFSFIVNGKEVQTELDMSLMGYLREVHGLYSVKNGCSEGACGTCSILVDGKLTKACILKTSKIEGKSIETLEGFSEREKEVYAHAFEKVGAVQCGFCTPGMIVAAKALIDTNPNPTTEDCKKGIRGNLCRCTGYVKIFEAILLSAKMFRENTPVTQDNRSGININVGRIDARPKALGTAKFSDDYHVEGMVHGKALRTLYPRARVLSIDSSKAMELPGVLGIYTAKDIPGHRHIGHLVQDWPAMIDIGEVTRYMGDSIVLVAAITEEILEQALKLIKVEYEELKPMTCPDEALAKDAPNIHEKGNLLSFQALKRGDSEKALRESKHRVEFTFNTPITEHAFLEPECAVGMPDGDGVKVITGGQGIYDEKREISNLLGLPLEKVRINSAYVGGGFGGKEDMSVQHHAAFLAFMLKKPVKVRLTRAESFTVHPKRHPMELEYKVGCDEEGILQGMQARIISDTGAYASLGGPVLQRACTHAAGPYNFQNVDIEGRAIYTNNPPAGAFRGFGVTQSCFAMESCINALAEKVGITPWEMRRRNAIKPGDELPNGQIADEGTAFLETLEAVKEEYEKYYDHPDYSVGISSAMKNAGLGVGIPDTGRCNIAIVDGKAHIRTSASCMGQGAETVMLQILCETTGLTKEEVIVDRPDTKYAPNAGTTTASRQTLLTGEATKMAALQVKEHLDNKKSLKDLEGQIFIGEFAPKTDSMGSDKKNPESHVAYGYATQVVVIDREGKLIKVIAAHDIGKAINPISTEGQIEGGVVMGLGYALTEDYKLENCVPKSKLGTLGLFKSTQVPEIEPLLIEKNLSNLAYGAKGIGEIVCIPTAPAVQNAYYNLDHNFRLSLPLEETFYKKKK